MSVVVRYRTRREAENEQRALDRLGSRDHLVRIIEVDWYPNTARVVSEYAGEPNVHRTLAALTDIQSTLTSWHSETGFVHRDLHWRNIVWKETFTIIDLALSSVESLSRGDDIEHLEDSCRRELD